MADKHKLSKEQHQALVLLFREAYEAGRSFTAGNKMHDYALSQGFKCTLRQAYNADLQARNEINADPTTDIVIPAASNQERNPNPTVEEALAGEFPQIKGTTTRLTNEGHRAKKLKKLHPNSLEIQVIASTNEIVETALQQRAKLLEMLESTKA